MESIQKHSFIQSFEVSDRDALIEDESNSTKLGTFRTLFTLLKGFIVIGFLLIPNGFYNGGIVFSICAISCSAFFTLICILKLVELR
jgi:amino acid permease